MGYNLKIVVYWGNYLLVGAIFLGGGGISIFLAGGGNPHSHSKGNFEISYLAFSEKAITVSKMLTFEYRVLVYFW